MNETNTKEYWDDIYRREGPDTWRIYPACFKRICEVVGQYHYILDVGCGVGVLAEMLQKNNNKVLGIDVSEVAMRHAMKRGVTVKVTRAPPLRMAWLPSGTIVMFGSGTERSKNEH